jgi:hypothetical protein
VIPTVPGIVVTTTTVRSEVTLLFSETVTLHVEHVSDATTFPVLAAATPARPNRSVAEVRAASISLR